ncbi:IclR family transcriptional regulator [Embleya sp. NPDC001921]
MNSAPDREQWSAIPSPPTDRVVAVTEFLASRPGEPATVAELVRRLGLNRATCHAVLAALVRAGWVVRDPVEKTFTPGPGLIALGRAAETGVPVARAAEGELAALVRELGMAVTAGYPSGEHIVVGSHLAVDGDAADVVRVGQRIPFAPPFGPGLVAWEGEPEIGRWLARAPHADPARTPRFRAVLATVRRRGYTVESDTPASRRLRALLVELDSLSPRGRPAVTELLHEIGTIDYLDDDLQEARTYPVGVMSAPAFTGAGVTALNISVYVWADLDPAGIRAVGDRLLAASRTITHNLRGTPPRDFPQGTVHA